VSDVPTFRRPVVLFAVALFVSVGLVSAAAFTVDVSLGLAVSGVLLAVWAWLALSPAGES
jgi:hypothetical protein